MKVCVGIESGIDALAEQAQCGIGISQYGVSLTDFVNALAIGDAAFPGPVFRLAQDPSTATRLIARRTVFQRRRSKR